LKIYFIRATKRNIHTSTVTRKQVEEQMIKWLVGARDRGERRIIRAEKAKEKRIQEFRQFMPLLEIVPLNSTVQLYLCMS